MEATDIIHVFCKFEDQFSGAKNTKIVTKSALTFEQMKKGIGTIFNQFDKSAGINYTWKVIEVRQATQEDYKPLNK